MNKKKIAKRVTTLFMSLAVAVGCLGFIPSNGSEVNAAEVETINVYISSQEDGAFLHVPRHYAVNSDLAESYGYEDLVDGVSALDVLVKAHEEIFGKQYVKTYLEVKKGSVKKFFSNGGSHFGFMIGGEQPHDGVAITDSWGTNYTGYHINQARVTEGQVVEFFKYRDTKYYSDNYCNFYLNDKKVNRVAVKAGGNLTMTVKGYSCAYFGCAIEETIRRNTAAIEGAKLAWVDEYGNIEDIVVNQGTISTEENGEFTVAIPNDKSIGDNLYLTAYITDEDIENYETPVVMPLCNVTVGNNEEVTGTFEGGVIIGSGGERPNLPSIKSTNDNAIEEATEGAAKNILQNYAGNPEYENEWNVMALARMGAAVPDGYYDKYYNNIVAKLKENNGGFDDRTYPTDYARVILTLTAIGRDVTDVGGYNLVEKMKEANENITQGNNAVIYTLIALNAVDSNKNINEGDYKEELLDKLIAIQKIDGGFSWNENYSIPDVDTTAMAIQAMAPFYDSNDDAKQAIEKAKQFILANQSNAGGYGSAESAAQAVLALTAIDIDPNATEALTTPERPYSIMDGLMRFYMGEGKFSYGTITGEENSYSTTQAFYALVDYQRFVDGKTSFYDMSDVEITYGSGDSGNNGTADTQDKNNGNATDTGEDFPVGLMMTIMLLAILTAGGVCYEYRKKV